MTKIRLPFFAGRVCRAEPAPGALREALKPNRGGGGRAPRLGGGRGEEEAALPILAADNLQLA